MGFCGRDGLGLEGGNVTTELREVIFLDDDEKRPAVRYFGKKLRGVSSIRFALPLLLSSDVASVYGSGEGCN
jgi:hypothetical protein